MNRLMTVCSLGCLVLSSCTNDDAKETGETGEPCTNVVEQTFPANGAEDAYFQTTVEIQFKELEEDAVITLEGPNGTVEGTTSVRGDWLVFTPSADLEAGADYTVGVDFSCGNPTVSWQTSELGPSVDPVLLTDKAFALKLDEARFVEPEGIGPLLQQFLTVDILMGIVEVSDTSIQFVGALGVAGADTPAQDTCQSTIDFPEASFTDNPVFTVGPADTTISVQQGTTTLNVEISALEISGAFAPDATYIGGAVLAGSVDTRPLAFLVGEDEGEGALCEAAGTLNIPCIPCPNDGEPFCLDLRVENILATEMTSGIEAPISDPCSRPECGEHPNCVEDPVP